MEGVVDALGDELFDFEDVGGGGTRGDDGVARDDGVFSFEMLDADELAGTEEAVPGEDGVSLGEREWVRLDMAQVGLDVVGLEDGVEAVSVSWVAGVVDHECGAADGWRSGGELMEAYGG